MSIISAVKYNQLIYCLENYVTVFTEWFYWKFSLLITYPCYISTEMTDQKWDLYIFITFNDTVMSVNISISVFCSQFIMYLSFNTHLCKCIKCISKHFTQFFLK